MSCSEDRIRLRTVRTWDGFFFIGGNDYHSGTHIFDMSQTLDKQQSFEMWPEIFNDQLVTVSKRLVIADKAWMRAKRMWVGDAFHNGGFYMLTLNGVPIHLSTDNPFSFDDWDGEGMSGGEHQPAVKDSPFGTHSTMAPADGCAV